MKRWLGLAVKLALSAISILYLFKMVHFEEALSYLTKPSPLLIIYSTLVLSLQHIIATVRWQAVLVALGTPMGFVKACQITLVSSFFNQALPSSVGGDAIRIYKAYKAGLSLPSSVNGVLLERLATVLGSLFLVFSFQQVFIERINGAISPWIIPLLTAAAVLGTGCIMLFDHFPAGLRQWRLMRGLVSLAESARSVFLRPRHGGVVLIWAVLGQVNIALGVWILGMALGLGDQLTLLDCLVLIPLVLLVTALPISIAGWGVREISMLTAFSLLGISSESAVAVSVLLGLQMIIISLPGGLVWLFSSDMRVREHKITDNQVP